MISWSVTLWQRNVLLKEHRVGNVHILASDAINKLSWVLTFLLWIFTCGWKLERQCSSILLIWQNVYINIRKYFLLLCISVLEPVSVEYVELCIYCLVCSLYIANIFWSNGAWKPIVFFWDSQAKMKYVIMKNIRWEYTRKLFSSPFRVLYGDSSVLSILTWK